MCSRLDPWIFTSSYILSGHQYHYFRSSWHIEIQQLQQHQHNGSTPFWKSTSFTEIPFVTWKPPSHPLPNSSPEVEHEAARGTPNPLEQCRSLSATLEVWNFCVFFFRQGKDQTGLNQQNTWCIVSSSYLEVQGTHLRQYDINYIGLCGKG